MPSQSLGPRSEEQNHIIIASVQLPNGIAKNDNSQFDAEKGGNLQDYLGLLFLIGY